MRTIIATVLITALLGGCMDLDVTNPNEPDRERVLTNPGDVESLISSAYQAYFDHVQATNPGLSTAAIADNLTGGFFDLGVHDITTQPRVPFDASPLRSEEHTSELQSRGQLVCRLLLEKKKHSQSCTRASSRRR